MEKSVLRSRLKSISNLAAPAWEDLRDISNEDLGYAEALLLDRALARFSDDSTGPVATIKLAVLSDCTIDQLLPSIRIAGLRNDIRLKLYKCHYGQFRQDVIDSSSELYSFEPDFVLFSLSARELVNGQGLSDPKGAERKLDEYYASIEQLWSTIQSRTGAIAIQQTYVDVYPEVFGNMDISIAGLPTNLINNINLRIAQAAEQEKVVPLDVTRVAARLGIDNWFEPTKWLQGKMEISPKVAPHFSNVLARLIVASKGFSKKCLVLDLDNTLWGGVIGDDGIEGILLGAGNAVGEAHAELQRYVKRLSERGVILAVCSKNDDSTAKTCFNEHPEMVLRLSDVASFVANWQDKASNIQKIAADLNIGLDSLVFVDDNPAERARVRESLPMVAVPELPSDPSQYVRCLSEGGYFESLKLTEEDLGRTEQYLANTSRQALATQSQSMEDYLANLSMRLTHDVFLPVEQPRITQLFGKTNQFNTTTQRYTTREIEEFANDANNITLQTRLIDRFGDNGLVSAMIMRPAQNAGELQILNWVMSCRVFGRQLEHEMLNIAVEQARLRGASTLLAEFHKTAKNGVIENLFGDLGFIRRNAVDQSEFSKWSLDLTDYQKHKTFITRELREQPIE